MIVLASADCLLLIKSYLLITLAFVKVYPLFAFTESKEHYEQVSRGCISYKLESSASISCYMLECV